MVMKALVNSSFIKLSVVQTSRRQKLKVFERGQMGIFNRQPLLNNSQSFHTSIVAKSRLDPNKSLLKTSMNYFPSPGQCYDQAESNQDLSQSSLQLIISHQIQMLGMVARLQDQEESRSGSTISMSSILKQLRKKPKKHRQKSTSARLQKQLQISQQRYEELKREYNKLIQLISVSTEQAISKSKITKQEQIDEIFQLQDQKTLELIAQNKKLKQQLSICKRQLKFRN